MHKILIVEQDRALNNGIALALKAESYLFLQAFGLKEADELLKKQKVELVILDLNLPDGDEVEFLKNIKDIPYSGGDSDGPGHGEGCGGGPGIGSRRLYHEALQSDGAAGQGEQSDSKDEKQQAAGLSVQRLLLFFSADGIFKRRPEGGSEQDRAEAAAASRGEPGTDAFKK